MTTTRRERRWTTPFNCNVLEVVTGDAGPVVIKTMRRADPGWRQELWARRILGEGGAEVAAPLLDVRRDDTTIALVMAHVPTEPEGLAGASDPLLTRLGEDLGRMHARCAADRFQRRSTRLLARAQADVRELEDLVCMPGTLIEAAERKLERAMQAAPLTLVHRDLRDDNLRLHDGRCLLIDWEVAAVGHPDLDVARLRRSLRPDRLAVFDDGYARGYGRHCAFDTVRHEPAHRAAFALLFAGQLWRYTRNQETRDPALVPFLIETVTAALADLSAGDGERPS